MELLLAVQLLIRHFSTNPFPKIKLKKKISWKCSIRRYNSERLLKIDDFRNVAREPIDLEVLGFMAVFW